ncbi:MAG: citrate (Si)-synthase [Candidatus Hydrogenedentota bacterium]|nr:MAG: citrate (Si)-synthase [Candidatus Hydrogenedentota bacterium]
MSVLEERLAGVIPGLREEAKSLAKEHGTKVISQVTVSQVYGGMRGVRGLLCDTSSVEPETGLKIRGRPVKELVDCSPEDIIHLLLLGELPDPVTKRDIQADLAARREVPENVWKVLDALPEETHPMTMLSVGLLAMQGESAFAKAYAKGIRKDEYWRSTLEDALDIIARITVLAAGIYRKRFNKGPRIPGDKKLPLALNFARMLGVEDTSGEFADLMRLYLVLHSDHESGNVSAATTATVNSALSDLYYSLSAGLNGLAGPLHGLANQECLKWVLMVHERFGGVPSLEEIEKFAWETLEAGKVIPGYGHAVLRVTDPRFEAFFDFGKKYCMQDEIFQTVVRIFETVPNVLRQVKKIKDPWPNVDAISGSLLYHYGVTEFPFYTVLFGVSRAIGVTCQAVLARALGMPIIRPKSVTTQWLKQEVAKKD